MHAVEQITPGSLLALIIGLIILVVISYLIFSRKKRWICGSKVHFIIGMPC